jgi:UDP-N-acetylglucosamine 2-epimerase (non-hydrolysing)
MFPVVHALREMDGLEVCVCVSAQHRAMLDQVLGLAGIAPDIDLDIMRPRHSLDDLTARLLTGLGGAMDLMRPDLVVVQGDTTTAMVATLAAHYRRIPVAHVEAGLRSGDLLHPWPEEANRRMISCIAARHFAPTERAGETLLAEGRDPSTVHVTGNTVIDAMLATRDWTRSRPALSAAIRPVLQQCEGRPIIVVTSHRRENFGEGVEGITGAIRELALRKDVEFVFPVHPNPSISGPVRSILSGLSNVHLIEPLDYPAFVALLDASYLVLTDSGGVQEEAPSLGKPVLVLRETTERPEGIDAGTARLIGTDRQSIIAAVTGLLQDKGTYAAMAQAHNPYGDGFAARRIATIIARGI